MSDTVPGIGVKELFEEVGRGAVLVDVRELHEFVEVHASKATLIPLKTVPDSLGAFPADQVVYVICRSGGRSHQACEWLRGQGIDAVNVIGGTLAWVEAELPVEHGSEPQSPNSANSANETSD